MLAELILTVTIVAGAVYIALFFYQWRFLPQPFTYDPSQTFMDWVTTAFYAHRPGAYGVWGTVYPPLSFAFLKIFSNSSCYSTDLIFGTNASTATLECDRVSQISIVGFYVINVFLTFLCLRRSDPSTAVLRTIAIACGLPMLFTLERGNLIMPCYTFFMLGHARILRPAWLRWLSLAMSINFKPYLALTVLPYGVLRRWRWLEGCGLATLLVYLVTYAIVGEGSPMEIFKNQALWLESTSGDLWWNLFYSTTYMSWFRAIHGSYPILLFFDSRPLDLASFVIPLVIRIGQVGVIAAMAAAWFRPGAATAYRLAALGLSLVLTASNPGGYTELFIVFMVFFERWKGVAPVIALVAAYLISIPVDHIVTVTVSAPQESWLGKREVINTYGISLGQFVRPGLLLIIQYALSAATLVEAWRLGPTVRAVLIEPVDRATAVETA